MNGAFLNSCENMSVENFKQTCGYSIIIYDIQQKTLQMLDLKITLCVAWSRTSRKNPRIILVSDFFVSELAEKTGELLDQIFV